MLTVKIEKKLYGVCKEMKLNVDLQIKEHSFVAIAGESGSGKTTLLRILAGLEKADGSVRINDEVWMDGRYSMPVQDRKIGFVFQDYALFENMTVEENLLFAEKNRALAIKLLEITELISLRDRMPGTLSGGQKQRVALCRAMMKKPRLLLMDEPLSALDPVMRQKLQYEIGILHQTFETTTLMVSHDPSEIYRLADRVIVLEKGEVVRDGTPKDILLKTQGSQKFSFEGELLDITKVDVIYIAVVSIGQQLVEVVVSSQEVEQLEVGQKVTVSTKAFTPIIV